MTAYYNEHDPFAAPERGNQCLAGPHSVVKHFVIRTFPKDTVQIRTHKPAGERNMRYQVLEDPKGQCAIRDAKTGKIIFRGDREDTHNEMQRILEDVRWTAANRD